MQNRVSARISQKSLPLAYSLLGFTQNTVDRLPITNLNFLMAANNMDTILQAVQDIIGYRFKERLILWEAMQAAGSNVRYAGDREFMDGNKRLAVIGDTVLQLVLAEQWYNGGTSRGILDALCTSL